MKKLKIGCVIGTRPEVIKMAPVYHELKYHNESWVEPVLIDTAQHRQLLDEELDVFKLSPDFDLNIMKSDQSLTELTVGLSSKLDSLYNALPFDAILAAGDTTTVLCAALTAFYHRIPFGHIEAGLRSFNLAEPFPEEMNRALAARLASYHFVPTNDEKENLLEERVDPKTIYVTGNPVIDALEWTLDNFPKPKCLTYLAEKPYILITSHRRENIGEPLESICNAINKLSAMYPDINFVYPVHPNPHVKETVMSTLAKNANILRVPPFKYHEFIHVMKDSLFIMTDSGGVQEEAPALQKPVLVLRNVTERPAIIRENLGILTGTNVENIVKNAKKLIEDNEFNSKLATAHSPYGDGHAAKKIVAILKNQLASV